MSSATSADYHEILIAGGGTAGLTLAARIGTNCCSSGASSLMHRAL